MYTRSFLKNVTTKDATCELINEILSALKAELIVGGNFCDLAKAFVLTMILNCVY